MFVFKFLQDFTIQLMPYQIEPMRFFIINLIMILFIIVNSIINFRRKSYYYFEFIRDLGFN
jgi:hypothetical protein